MKSILLDHTSVLKELPLFIAEKYRMKVENIKLINISTIDENILTFQLSFFYPSSDPMKEIVLKFELKENTPDMLYFETLTGLKGFGKLNEYHGLENEIVKYISIQTDD